MAKNKIITVKGTEIILFSEGTSDFISLTDIAKHKDFSKYGHHYSKLAAK